MRAALCCLVSGLLVRVDEHAGVEEHAEGGGARHRQSAHAVRVEHALEPDEQISHESEFAPSTEMGSAHRGTALGFEHMLAMDDQILQSTEPANNTETGSEREGELYRPLEWIALFETSEQVDLMHALTSRAEHVELLLVLLVAVAFGACTCWFGCTCADSPKKQEKRKKKRMPAPVQSTKDASAEQDTEVKKPEPVKIPATTHKSRGASGEVEGIEDLYSADTQAEADSETEYIGLSGLFRFRQ